MPRYWNKLAALIKRETTYGVDATPTGAANAIDLNAVTISPFEGQEDARDLMRPYLGNQGKLLTANYAKVEFSIELAGSGVVGTPPAYGAILRACGLAEVVAAGVSVSYLPVSGGFESASSYWNMDGVLHRFLGARGTVTGELPPSRIPRLKFSLWGLLGAVEDLALPAVTLTAFQRAVEISKTNTTFSLHGFNAVAETFSFDLGNQVEPRFLIGKEAIEIVDRKTTGSATIEAVPVGTVDWFARARARTRAAVSLVHGVTPGNIVTIAGPAVELGRPTYGQTQRITNQTIPFDFCPVAGDDEFSITFT